MKPSKPEWYAKLKQEPFVIRTFDSGQSLKVMTKLSAKRNRRPSLAGKTILGLSALLIVILAVTVIPEARHPVARPQPILDAQKQILYLDPNWRTSRDLVEVYQTYITSPENNILAALPPTDILKLWRLAVQFNNEAFQRQLMVRPAAEMFSRDKVITSWEKWNKNYYITETIQGEYAELTLAPDVTSSEVYRIRGAKKIRLSKSESGIWQIEHKDLGDLLEMTE